MPTSFDAQARSPHASPLEQRRTLVSILVPIYNECPHIREVIERILAAAMPEGVDRELVIVNDGSTDGTEEELGFFEHHPAVRLHHLEKNCGKGAAIRSGLAVARGDIIVIQDGDTEYRPDELQLLIRPIQQGRAKIVYGSRFIGSARDMYLRYRLANRLLVWAVRILYGAQITDEATAYKAFHRSVIEKVPLQCVRFEFCPEVTAKVLRLGYSIEEVPINYTARTKAEGKKIRLRDGVQAFWTLARYWRWKPPASVSPDDDTLRENLDAVGQMQNYRRWIYRSLEPHLGPDVLEAGCGNGNLASLIVNAPGLRRYVGLDHCQSLCAELREHLAPRQNIKWSVDVLALESAAFLDYAAEPFDSIVCLNVLEHIFDDEEVLRSFRRVLKPGGRLLLLVPMLPSIYGSIDRAVRHVRRYTRRELLAKLKNAGFEVKSARYFNLLGIAAWVWHGKILRLPVHPSREMRAWDRLVPLLAAVERRLPLPIGLSSFVVAQVPSGSVDAR